ncbi:MAG: radical SAM protein [Desulfobulbaceae bacterium]|nr:radical SAM protein [Desulfobulbaceae bacterium]HIJ89773.1 radical SAM protein [Deltaproteobacteria bacterium]
MQRQRIRVALLYRGPQHEGRDDFSSFVPIGLFNVLKSLRSAGYDAGLHNLSATPRTGLAEAIRNTGADAFLISAFFGCHHEAYTLARTIKKQSQRTMVALGGPLSVLGPAILEQVPEIDFLILGEGEEAAVALLDSFFLQKIPLSAVHGALYRTSTGISENPRKLLADIDRCFFLPSEVIPHCHGVQPENFAVLISSRGCPFRCTFCSSTVLWQNRVRHHSVDLLLSYLIDLRAATGAIYFSLRDENFLVNRTHVRKFTAALRQSGLHYLWNAQGSPHLLDDDLARTLAEAGCDQLQMGIEAIPSRLAGMLNKQGSPDQTAKAINILRRQAIRPFGYFIYGMNETETEGAETLNFIQHSGLLDAVASPLVLYPGTGLAQGMDPDCFFSKGEVLFYSPSSARKWKKKYQQALAGLHEREGFRREEVAPGKTPNPVRTVARHFYLLAHGEKLQAEQILLNLTKEQPENPWGFELLARLYSVLGKKGKALTMRKKLSALTGCAGG